MTHIGTQRRRELRRMVLLTLREAAVGIYEGWMSARSVWACVRPAHDATLAEVTDALDYLAGKGYAADEDRRARKYDERNPSYRITPHGQDLLDEVIDPDPGVEDDRA